MTTEQFQELVNVFRQQPGGIENIAGILALANCIGKLSSADLAQSLDYDWLVSLGYKHPVPFENTHVPDPRYPDNPFTLPRQNMLARLSGMLSYASVSNCPIVIFGQPGTGKSRLLSQLAYSSWGELFEKKRVIYLNGGGLEAYLRAWHLEIYGFQAPASMRSEDLTAALRLQEKTNRQIVLIDSVAHVSFIRPILEIFKDTSSVVILALHQGLKTDGLHTDKRLMLTLPGFTLAESIELYEKGGACLDPKDLSDFTALHKTLKGNPLALYYAFQNVESEGLARLVHLLNSTDIDIPQEMLKEIFVTLQVGFERQSACLQKSFARLGAMKRLHLIDQETLAALWANSPEEIDLEKTAMLVNQLQASIGPFEPIRGQIYKWKLHDQTHLFAKSKLAETESCEQILANQWFARTVQSGNLSMPTTSLKEAAQIHLTARLKKSIPLLLKQGVLSRLAQLLIFRIDPGREVIEHNVHRLTPYEYFVAQTLDQRAYSRRKWFWLWQIDLGALLMFNLLFPNNHWSSSVKILLLLVFILTYGKLCCSLTKSTCLWTLLWRQVSRRSAHDNS